MDLRERVIEKERRVLVRREKRVNLVGQHRPDLGVHPPGRRRRAVFVGLDAQAGRSLVEAVVVGPDIGADVVAVEQAEPAVEAGLQRPGLERRIPVGHAPAVAGAQVPLAEDAGDVALLLEHLGQGQPVRGDGERAAGAEHAAGHAVAPAVAPGHDAVAAGRTDRCRGVGVGEAHALAGQPVAVRRRVRAAVAGQVAVPQVVGQDDDDVRPFGRGRAGNRCRARERRQRQHQAQRPGAQAGVPEKIAP